MRRFLAALIVVACVASCGGGSNKKAGSADNRSTYLFPTYLAPGFKVTHGGVQVAGPAHRAYGAALGRKAKNGAFDAVILVTAIEATADRAVSPNEKDTIVGVNGAQARLHEGATEASLDWFAHGAAIALAGPPASGQTLLTAARALRGEGVRNLHLETAPDGYDKIAEEHTIGHTPEASRQIQVAAASPTTTITITTSATNIKLVFAVGGGDHIEPIEVRGHEGLLSTRTRQVQGTSITQSIVAWYERSGALVSIIGNTAPDQLLPIADGLAGVGEELWRQLVPQS
ncbi:MAG TPA: hypothetical protein VFB78_19160 [Acidimicrobiales bacterium]|nr:hypothetical protein [Acidimicrobiales bacterium]